MTSFLAPMLARRKRYPGVNAHLPMPSRTRIVPRLMKPRSVASYVAEAYDRNAERYRRDDEIEAGTENHKRLGGNLQRICRSFGRPIRVLELGCGTGRYFHWLENVELLVGTDISAEMLQRAKNPLQRCDVTAAEIRLLQGNIYELNFEPESFHFIYSLGVFGYGAELTIELCSKLERWLTPGGRLYFDAIENLDSRRFDRFKDSVKAAVYPRLPAPLRTRLEARNTMPVFYHSRADMENRMRSAGFEDFALSSNTCNSPLWTGAHLECVGRKSAERVAHRSGSHVRSAEVETGNTPQILTPNFR
jgi:ubiquinone/menaquinone biosynthesis C-methylase UbiE